MSFVEKNAASLLPTAALSTAITTGVRKTVDLSGYLYRHVDLRATAAYRIRAAAAAASLPTAGAMAADMPRSANVNERFLVTRDTQHVAVYMATAGTFYWAPA